MPESPLRILVVVTQLTIGGTERSLLAVLPRLDRRRFAVEVATTRGPGRLDSALREAGIPVHTPPALLPRKANVAVAGPALLWRALTRPPDIAHFFLPEAYLVGGLASLAALRTRRIMSRRSLNRYQRTRPLVTRLEGWLHRRMDAVVGNSRAVTAELAAEGAPAERLALIPNGIDTARFRRQDRGAARAALGLPDGSFAMVMLATLLPYKGHADVLQALGAVRGDLPEGWCLLLAGRDEGIGGALKEQARSLGIADNVRFLGELTPDEVPKLLAAGDLGLLASHEEGFPNAALETMAAGLPMLATAAGGAAEAVEDRITGRLVPPQDPAALSQALRELAADPPLRARFGAAGKELVAARFSLERSVALTEALYTAVATGGSIEGLGSDTE